MIVTTFRLRFVDPALVRKDLDIQYWILEGVSGNYLERRIRNGLSVNLESQVKPGLDKL
jgi:hypothetical protein